MTPPLSPDAQILVERWTAWLASDAPRRLTASTIQDYRRQLERLLAWIEETLGIVARAEAITAYRVETYFEELAAHVAQTGHGHARHNKAVAALGRFGVWLVEQELLPTSPTRRLRVMAEQPSPPRALPRRTIRRVLDAAHHTGDVRDALVLELLAYTGMRASEVIGLRVEHLEQGQRKQWVQVIGKGQKVRRIPLSTQVHETLEQYLTQRAAAEGQRPEAGPLLVGIRGPITRTTINRIVADVAR